MTITLLEKASTVKHGGFDRDIFYFYFVTMKVSMEDVGASIWYVLKVTELPATSTTVNDGFLACSRTALERGNNPVSLVHLA